MKSTPLTPTSELFQTLAQHKLAAVQHVHDEQWALAAEHGSLSLEYEAQWVCQQAAIHRHLVVFSLYGNDPLYCETALLNAQMMPSVYPNWTMRVYHDDSVPQHVRTRLQQQQVELIRAEDVGIGHWPGTFWRFAAASDPTVERVLFRDADSLIGAREAQWVADWLNSPQPFHVMRDWYSHTDLILAGLWGAYAPLLSGMVDWVNTYLSNTPNLHPTHADQVFLAQKIWPKIHRFCRVHDTVHPNLMGISPLYSPREGSHASDALGGFKAKLVTVTLPPNTHQYHIVISDVHGQKIIEYVRTAHEQKDEYYLPIQYYEHIETGRWILEHTLAPPTYSLTIQKAEPAAAPECVADEGVLQVETEPSLEPSMDAHRRQQPEPEYTLHITAQRG